MLSYNLGNDFKIDVLPTIGGVPIDFSSAEEIIVVITDPSNNKFNPGFDLIEDRLKVEIKKEDTRILGEYFLKIQYRIPDPTFSDQYQDKTIGLNAFKIVPVGSATNNNEGVIEFEITSADDTPSGATSTNKLEFHIENDFKFTLRPTIDDVLVDLDSMIDLEVICISYSKKQFIPSFLITEAGIEIEIQKESIDVPGDYLVKLKYKLQDASYQDGYRHVTNAINAFIIKPLDETLSAAGTEIDVEGSKWYKGDDGSTPEIGANGNWFIDGVDTGKPSLIKKTPINFATEDWVNVGGLFSVDLFHDLNQKMSAEIYFASGERIICDYNNSQLNKITLYSAIRFDGYALLT
jgi:hypothetical protein